MSKAFVPIGRVDDNPHQSRLDVGDIQPLARTILEHGLQSVPPARLIDAEGALAKEEGMPLTMAPTSLLEDNPDWRVQLAAGHRRKEAVALILDICESGGVLGGAQVTERRLKRAGLRPGHMLVEVKALTDEDMLDVLTVENAQREALSAIEQARLIGELAGAGRSGQEIADRFGKSPSWVSNRKRLTELPTYVQEHVHEGDLSVREGQALIKAFALEEEHAGAYEKLTRTELKPGNITTAAMRGEIDSDGIRARTEELEEVLSRIERATHDTPGADQGERARPEESSTSQNADQTDDDRRPENQTSGSDERDDARTPAEDASGASDGRSREVVSGHDENVQRGQAGDGAGERDGEEGAADRPVRGDGAPTDQEVKADEWPIRGRFRKSYQPYMIRICEETLDEIAQYPDCEVMRAGEHWHGPEEEGEFLCVVVNTTEGSLQVEDGWIAEDSSGEHYPISDEEVQSVYELVGEVDAPRLSQEAADVGTVNPDQVDTLLAPGEDMWDAGAAAGASVASLYVAYVVADKRMERWRREEIAQEMRDRQERVTEEDFPDDVWEDVQAEIERRLEPEAA